MALAFQRRQVSLPSGTGRRSINGTVSFRSPVRTADISVMRTVDIAVNGFKFDYVSSDHHINVVEVDTDITSIVDHNVHFRVEADYADKNFDDKYRGYVEVLVIADLA